MDGGLMAFLNDQQGNTEALHETTRGPWVDGYNSAVESFMAGVTHIVGETDGSDANSSRDVVLDPFTGAVIRRNGCVIQNDTLLSLPGVGKSENTGILENKWSAKARKVFALDSPSLSDGLPTTAILYGNDTTKRGTIYLSSTNSGATTNALKNYSLLEDFSDGNTYSNDPATDTGSSKYRMKVVPTFVDSGAGLYNRGAYPIHRQFLTSGSRSVLQTQKWLYAPNLYGNPFRWNKRFNESGTIGSETVRVFPTGPWSPLFPPRLEDASTTTGNNTWVDGDTFFYSVLFQFEDGSYSAPFIPRQINSTLTNGLGYHTVGTPTSSSSAHSYAYVDWNDIPIGPYGTIARVLLRTPKQTRTSASDLVTVTPLDLRIITIINNNRDTFYRDFAGDDNALIEDTDVVRIDHVLPRRARYIGTGDQRAVVSYTLPNQSAIMLAPLNETDTVSPPNYAYDHNLNDDSDALYTANAYYFRILYSDWFFYAGSSATSGYFTPSVRI